MNQLPPSMPDFARHLDVIARRTSTDVFHANEWGVSWGGEIIEEGRTAEVFAAPRSPFTRTLIDSIPLPEVRENWLD